ncbi:pre-peptidase C-terminal domain-containing protein [Leptolyngbya sp. FACHB-321]|nr:pre-peptidase C-terminal domain-containing protein [Leptolyngbya sp. FACHB-321]
MNYRQATDHFIRFGRWENRQASQFINSDYARNTFDSARDVFFDNNSVVFRDSIQNSDPNDFYRFNLSTQRGSSFRLQLNGLTSNLNVELYNSNRQLILQSSNAGTTGELLAKNLAAGTYYIKVYQAGTGSASNYNLNISSAPLSTGNYFADKVVDLTNVQRVQFGLTPLLLQLQLTSAAQTHSQNMALSDFFSHTGADGSSASSRAQTAGYSSSYVGENIAAGYITPEEVIQGWMNSSGHRANILNMSYQEIGVGYYYLANDGGQVNYKHYWTQGFGAIF